MPTLLQVVSQYSSLLAPMAVDCVYRVLDRERPESVDLADIKIVKRLGGTVDDSQAIDGLVLSQARRPPRTGDATHAHPHDVTWLHRAGKHAFF